MQKIIFIGDGSSIHLKKWITFFTKNFKIILISDTKIDKESNKFWEENNVETYDFNIKGNKFFKILNLFRKILMYNYIILKNRKNIFNYHYIGLNILISIPSIFFINKKTATFWGSDFNLASGLQKIIIKIVSIFFNKITSDSEDILNGLEQKYSTKKNKLVYINHGVDEKTFKTANYTKNNQFVIFSPRALNEFYNHHILFENIEKLEKSLGSIKLVFINYNGDKNYLKKLLKVKQKYPNKIEILPKLNQYELAKQYNLSDIVISIPKNDGMPVTLIESFFCKKPILLINNKNYNKIIHNKFILDTISINEIINKILYIKENKNEINNYINKLYKEFLKKLSYTSCMNKMKNIYLNLK